ncbi:MAG: DUF4097 family beta strand repeat protein [Clostridia bacterium]|nr:DUF4097 family beta strand repeat protein [Clostridia bacterium]
MKPSSIIFLIVSVFVIAAGCVLCSVGSDMAAEQGVALFDTDVAMIDGNIIRSDTFNAAEVNKIKMSLDAVHVYIGASETGESYLELHNFQVGAYDYTIQNKMLLIDNETSLFSLMRIAEGNFSFRGLRHYLTYKAGANTEKSLYIYLAEGASLNAFDIAVERGSVTVENLSAACDYNIALKAGDITLRNISTKSIVNLSTNKGVVTADGVNCRAGTVIVGEGAADLFMTAVPGELSVSVMEGDIDCGYGVTSEYGLLLYAEASGDIFYNGEAKSDRPFNYNASPVPSLQSFAAENGSVSIAIKAEGISGRFGALSEELEREAETEDLDVIVVETEAPAADAE